MINKMKLIQQQATTITSLIQENVRLVNIILGDDEHHGMADFLTADVFEEIIKKLEEDYRGRNDENK